MRAQLLSGELERFDAFLSRFTIIKETEKEIICHCPSCGKDKLYISADRNRSGAAQVLLSCKHDCDYKAILQAAGAEPKELYLTTQRRFTKDECADKRQHVYNDQSGAPLFQKTIYKYHTYWEYNGKRKFPGDKEVFWERSEGGSWTRGGSCNVLYHLDRLRGDTVYIPEGEKDVETLEKMGYIATTAGGGAKNTATEWSRNNYAGQLSGIKKACILADNDEIGIKYAFAVAEYLTASGIECKVIPATAIYAKALHKWDISDIAASVTADKARELLEAATAAADIYTAKESAKPAPSPVDDRYNKDGSGRLTEANLRNALDVLGISVRFNTILHKPEISGECLDKYAKEGQAAVLPMVIYDRLQHYLKGVTPEKIGQYINNILFSKESVCNPILDAIDAEKWDGSDRLGELYEIMHISEQDALSRILLRKWLMQAYCALHNELVNPFPVEYVLVLVGRQGYGKTSLFRKLAIN
jgi:phosphoribosyl-AMP cyclohydrolase